jgi:hypothetical protein
LFADRPVALGRDAAIGHRIATRCDGIVAKTARLAPGGSYR